MYFYLDDLNLGIFNDALPCCGSLTERDIRNSSLEISAEFNGQISTKKDKQELSMDKGTNLDKENSWHNNQCNQYRRPEKQKLMKKCPKRPAWNINKPLKRYVPASAKYPVHLQREKEEKKVRRQMELLHLIEKNNRENLSQNRHTSPEVASSHRETESDIRLHLSKKVRLFYLITKFVLMFLNSVVTQIHAFRRLWFIYVGYRKSC